MAMLLGKVEEFDPKKEEWSQHVERLGHFFEADAITDADRKKAAFLAMIGPGPYKMLRSLLVPISPKDKTYDELVAALKKQYDPKPSEIVQRFKFHSWYEEERRDRG